MDNITESQNIDQIVWSCIKDSLNPLDHLDFIRHTFNRPFEQEKAFELALAHWGNKEAPRLGHLALQKVQSLADEGNALAMLNLGRWYRLGYFVAADNELGVAWYRKGADRGNTRCLINLGRCLAKDDPQAAVEIYRQAIALGDLCAHIFWSDIDLDQRNYHLELGAKSADGYALYAWGYQLFKEATTEEARIAAAEIIKDAAQRNDSMACLFLGIHYRAGNYLPMDEVAAMQWLQKSARLGHETAYAMIGKTLLSDKQTEQDALAHLKRAAMLDEAHGQYLLGKHMIAQGATPEEQAQGVGWLRLGAVNGYKPAICLLADTLALGLGEVSNKEEALEWLHKGVAAGIADCQVSLACHYMTGEIVEVDKERGHNLFNLASLQGDIPATYLLGCTYEAGDGTEVDTDKAIACFKEAAKKGHTKAQCRLGYCYLTGSGVKEDIPAAAKWLKLAAEANQAEAQFYLGLMFMDGQGVEADNVRAHYWLDMASRQNHPEALRVLGLMLERGEGLNPSREDAQRYLAKAAALGDEEAKDWIAKNCPEKPAWLKNLSKLGDLPSLDDAQAADES